MFLILVSMAVVVPQRTYVRLTWLLVKVTLHLMWMYVMHFLLVAQSGNGGA